MRQLPNQLDCSPAHAFFLRRQVREGAWRGQYSLVYVTPELLANNPSLLETLHARAGLALVAVDEAHCVSEWGHDFRPEYRRLDIIKQASLVVYMLIKMPPPIICRHPHICVWL